MDLTDDGVQQRGEADRREVDPPVEVETAKWAPGGQLDWWVMRSPRRSRRSQLEIPERDMNGRRGALHLLELYDDAS
jgi:hypothetical protein